METIREMLRTAGLVPVGSDYPHAERTVEAYCAALELRARDNALRQLPDWKIEDVLAENARLRADNLSSLMRGRKLEREWWLARIETCENGGDIADLMEAATLQIEQLPDPQSWHATADDSEAALAQPKEAS